MKYVIFDDKSRQNFFPITLNRSTGDLRNGILKLRQRLVAYFNIEEIYLIVAEELATLYQERHPDWKINQLPEDDVIFLNSRLQVNTEIVEKINQLQVGQKLVANNGLVAVRLKTKALEIQSGQLEELVSGLESIKIPGDLLWENLWQLITENPQYIAQDFQEFFYDKDNFYETEMGVTILNPYNVWIGENTELGPGVVIDASQGPVVLDEAVRIMPNSVIFGPAFIGKNTVVKSGTRIYEGCSIGPVCKVGGELENTILQAYSNKQHEGFLGHSYLGEWINLGANTNNSDLKNNYKPVKAWFYPDQKLINTGYTFMGAILADHVKTAINSTINTGTVVGLGANLFGSSVINGFIPSLKWGNGSDAVDYDPAKFLETVALVKARRGLELTKAESLLLNSVRELEQKII